MPRSTSLVSRSESVLRAICSERWNSSNRVTPCMQSRRIIIDQVSPKTSAARATEHGHAPVSRFIGTS